MCVVAQAQHQSWTTCSHATVCCVCVCAPQLREELVGALAAVKDAARRVAKVELECKMALDW